MAINNLSQGGDTVTGADQIPIGQASSGQDRRVSANALKEFVQEDFVPAGGILALASVYAMRIFTPRVIALTTVYANVPNYELGIMNPSNASSVLESLVVGEYVATRDMAMVQFWVGLTGSWPTNRDLTVAVLVGPDATPFESAFRFVGAGRGVGNPVTAAISGIASNLNNPFGIIKAGEKIKLVVKFSVADNLNLDRLSFAIMTMDGQ